MLSLFRYLRESQGAAAPPPPEEFLRRNGILQKPEKIDAEEFARMAEHPALAIMEKGRGTEFEPALYDNFLNILSAAQADAGM
ncbi:MAG TPA: hypothetical protein VIS30_03480 [Candidatus Deferrimicrobiaceae bacterium]